MIGSDPNADTALLMWSFPTQYSPNYCINPPLPKEFWYTNISIAANKNINDFANKIFNIINR